MSRPPLEVADIIRAAGQKFIERSRQWLTGQHVKVLRAIACCRTAVLGGHRDRCSRCGHIVTISYNSCRDRHCPKCQGNARLRWIQGRTKELLPTPTLFLRCLIFWRPLHSRIRNSSTRCCSASALKP